MEIDITDFFNEADAFEFSASRMERGENAGPETWANAKEEGARAPLLTTPEQLDAMRDYFSDFGAWSREEIAAWDATECNALFIQMVSGDIREAGAEAYDANDFDWEQYEKDSEAGQCGGNLFRGVDGQVWYQF